MQGWAGRSVESFRGRGQPRKHAITQQLNLAHHVALGVHLTGNDVGNCLALRGWRRHRLSAAR